MAFRILGLYDENPTALQQYVPAALINKKKKKIFCSGQRKKYPKYYLLALKNVFPKAFLKSVHSSLTLPWEFYTGIRLICCVLFSHMIGIASSLKTDVLFRGSLFTCTLCRMCSCGSLHKPGLIMNMHFIWGPLHLIKLFFLSPP